MNQRDYRVNLLFGADITMAQQNIAQLGSLLKQLETKTEIGFETGRVREAVRDIQQLQMHLQNAVNIDTGKLDLSKFNTSLKMSKATLSQYSSSLLSLGPTGQQAFARLATAISQAEVPMYRLSAKTREFMTTLGNTAKWQIASTAIHGITGALSESIRYVEKFDKALTDIRIVSDINDKQLLAFSKRTREIAKEVNSTALEVAQGSTIYFQQGLSEEQVAERVAITTKMANITGENAEKVSSQLTAIWNNFSDGTKSLESYADALAYLGAKTAADTNQIATATEKFAASAKVVGLSYEYASAAVAEVIDRTQMAPEEVGTAFKTILSRMQGLELGETLEDGVELNKYAEALDIVGVKVLDANGGLRDADTILKDLGAKWDDLDAAQKKALATTVAGVRQQTQFMALMEEWDDIEASVADLGNSTNYLTQANDEYADSIEGVKKKLQDVKDQFFAKLLGGDADSYGEDFLKGFYKSMIDLIEQADRFVSAFGGLKPMALTFIGLFAKQLMPSLMNGVRNLTANVQTLFGFTESRTKKLQNQFNQIINTNVKNGTIDTSMANELALTQDLTAAKQRLTDAVKHSGQFEKDIVKYQIQQYEQSVSVLQTELEKQHSLEKQVELQKQLLVKSSKEEVGKNIATENFRKRTLDMDEETQNKIIETASNSSVGQINQRIQQVQAEMSPQGIASKREALTEKRDALWQQLQQQKKVTRVYEDQDSMVLDGTEKDVVGTKKVAGELLKDNQVTDARGEVVADGTAVIEKTAVRKDFDAPDVDTSSFSPYEKLQRNIVDSKREEKALSDEIKRINKEINQAETDGLAAGEEEIANLEEAKKLKMEMLKQQQEFNEATKVQDDSIEIYNDPSSELEADSRELSDDIIQDTGIMQKIDTGDPTVSQFNMETSIENTSKLIAKQSELADSTKRLASMDKEFSAELDKVNNKLKASEKAGDKDSKSKRKMAKELASVKKSALSAGKEIETMAKKILKGKSGSKVVKDIEKALKNLAKAGNMKDVQKNMDILNNALKKTKGAAQDASGTVDKAVDVMINSLKQSGVTAQSLDALEANLKQLGLWSEDTAHKMRILRAELQGSTPPVATFGSLLGKGISTISSFAGSLSMAVSGLQMIRSAFEEANSPGEALMNYLMGLSMVLPVVGTAFSGVSKAVKFLTADKVKLNAVSLISIATAYKEAAAEAKNAGMTGLSAAAHAMKACIEQFGWPGIIVGGIAAAAIAAMFGVAIAGAFGAMGAGKEKQDKENAEESAKEVAAKTAKGLSDQLSSAREEADNLKSSFDEYNDIASKLASCTKGTQEWTDALIANNEKVNELMDKYPELAKYVSMGSDGQLIISAEGQQALMHEAGQKVAKAQLANHYYNDKKSDDEIAELEKKAEAKYEMQRVQTGTKKVEKTFTYDDDPRAVPVTITVDEPVYEDKMVAAGPNSENIEEADKLIAKYGLNDALDHLSEITADKQSGVRELIENEQKLAAAVAENTAATLANSQTIGAQAMQGNAEYENSKYKENIAAVAGDQIVNGDNGTSYDKILADISARSKVYDDGNADWDKEKNEKIWNEYMKDTFGENVQWRNTDFRKDGMTAEVYNAETFEWEKKEFTNEQVAATVAGKRNLEGAEEYNNQMAKQMNSFSNENQADIFTAALTGNGSFLSDELLKKSKKELDAIVESMEISEETFKKMKEEGMDFGDNIKDQRKNFKKYQKEIIDSSKGFRDLKKNATGALGMIKKEALDNADAIAKGQHVWSDEAVKQAGVVSKSLSAALGADADLGLGPEFIAKNQGIIDDFINGVEGSGDRLKAALQEDAIIDVTANIKDEEMKAKLQNLHNNLVAFENKDWQVGVGLDPKKEADFYAACQNMIDAAGMTAEQAQQYFGKMGYDVTFKKDKKKVSEIVWNKKYNNTYDDKGNLTSTTVDAEAKTIVSEVEVPVIETITPNASFGGNINNISSSSPSTTNTSTGGNTGGNTGGDKGGDKNKTVQKKDPAEAKKEEEEIERYYEITNLIEDQERALDRLADAKDQAYGANKLKAIDKEIAAMKGLISLENDHLDQIKENIKLDKAKAAQFGITFDEQTGHINNYDEIIKAKMKAWEDEENRIIQMEYDYEVKQNEDENYDADGTEQKAIENARKKNDEAYEEFKEAIQQYEDSLDLFEDTIDKIQEQYRQIAEALMEKINLKFEMKVEFNEFEVDLIDFQLEKMGDKFDTFGEAAALSASKLNIFNDNIGGAKTAIEESWKSFEQGTLSLDDFTYQMEERLPDILDNMSEILSLDAEMMEYYANAFDAAEDEFSNYLDLIDHGIGKLDHFKNILSLIGKESNNKMMGVVLEAQYKSATDRLTASTDWYETTKTEYDALYTRWVNEKDSLGPKELEMLEEKLKVARTKMKEADDQRLSDLEAVGEKAQEILQNNLDAARKKLEENLVGSSLEDYMTDLDRLSKKQEEYLTNTNKMYETNKLIRQAQQDMDKTDNNRAKQQYNDYIKYIGQLQESGKLSEYELSIAQAKYELLQAQIALEEAQDAKNQVRLTRDSEGNYGYVYTANEDKVSEAEQAVADAENALYNIGLEGAQDYQSKKAETLQEAVDTFASIEEQYQTGQIETEAEFNQKMQEAKQYYYGLLASYDDLYYKALGVMQDESYDNTLDYELSSVDVYEEFKDNVDGYLEDVETAFDEYDTKVQVVKDEVGDNLGELKKVTSEVTDETKKLTTETDKLTEKIDDQLLSVRAETSYWGARRDELYKNIKANYELIEQLREIQELQMLGDDQDYSLALEELIAQRYGYDDRIVQETLMKRWDKMGGKDENNYQAMMDEEYAKNGESDWYKALKMMRDYKIERTDWSSYGDVEWAQSLREEKLAKDWSEKIRQYVGWNWNKGITMDDPYLQELLGIRQAKINSMADSSGVMSNEELLKELGLYIVDNTSYDTGGYTGNWGPEGRFAILHEKELVLNKQDTENFLSATGILREISQMLDNNALLASLGMINLRAMTLNSPADQVLQQEVTIHADFPNVTDHNEIEIAIDNLINAASQHAYRT